MAPIERPRRLVDLDMMGLRSTMFEDRIRRSAHEEPHSRDGWVGCHWFRREKGLGCNRAVVCVGELVFSLIDSPSWTVHVMQKRRVPE
jgi:hypothetical protein